MKPRGDLFDETTFFERVVKTRPNYIHALIPLAEACTHQGFYDKGLQIDKRLAKLCPNDPVIHYNLACSYALLGQIEEALSGLEKAIKLGYRDFVYLKKDRDLKSLHHDPKFKALIQAQDR